MTAKSVISVDQSTCHLLELSSLCVSSSCIDHLHFLTKAFASIMASFQFSFVLLHGTTMWCEPTLTFTIDCLSLDKESLGFTVHLITHHIIGKRVNDLQFTILAHNHLLLTCCLALGTLFIDICSGACLLSLEKSFCKMGRELAFPSLEAKP